MMAYHQGFPSHLATLNQWLVIGKSPPHRKDQLWSKTSSAGSAVIVSTRPSNCSDVVRLADRQTVHTQDIVRSEEHTSEIQSLMRLTYAVFSLKKKKTTQ